MNKTLAVASANRKHPGGGLNRDNAIFSIDYGTMPCWWLDIPLARIYANTNLPVHLILYERIARRLHHLVVPVDYLRSNIGRFAIQLDTESINLQLCTEPGRLFHDMKVGERGLSLAQFLCPCFLE